MSEAMMAAASLYNDSRFFSPSEVRIRENKKRRAKIVRRQYITLITVISAMIFAFFFFTFSLLSDAQSDTFVPEYKYYKTITVHTGDTISNIAVRYFDSDKYKNLDQYISEIEDINGLGDTSLVMAGEQLIIPYYSTEYK